MKAFKGYINALLKTFKNFFILIIIIKCFIPNKFFIKSTITLPFSYINKKTLNSNFIEKLPKDYFESFINNTLYTTIKINNKDINFHISTERFTIYISENTLIQNFDEEDKNNKKDTKDLYSLEYIGISEAKLNKNSFQFLQNKTNYIDIKNISYFLVKKLIDPSSNFQKLSSWVSENEEIGFNIYKGNPYEKVVVGDDDETEDFYSDIFDFDDDDQKEENKTNENEEDKNKNKLLINGGYLIEDETNLIIQLKKNKIINSYSFLIKYNNTNNINEEKGEIIIGGLPHEYDPKHFSEKYFIYDYVPMGDQPPYNWHLFFDKITFGDKIIAGDENLTYFRHVAFSIDFGFILASYTFKNYFYENFFNEYKHLCFEEIIDKYSYIYCQEEVIQNFKSISFYLSKIYNSQINNTKIEFDYKDFFIKSKQNPKIYYFQIIFTEFSNKWILGRPLFKKYPTIFDQDKKMIGFYLESGEYDSIKDDNKDENEKNGENNAKNNNNINFWHWIIICFLGLCVIVLSIILYKVIPLIRRKKKANELDEDYNYEPHNDKIEPNEEEKLYKE